MGRDFSRPVHAIKVTERRLPPCLHACNMAATGTGAGLRSLARVELELVLSFLDLSDYVACLRLSKRCCSLFAGISKRALDLLRDHAVLLALQLDQSAHDLLSNALHRGAQTHWLCESECRDGKAQSLWHFFCDGFEGVTGE